MQETQKSWGSIPGSGRFPGVGNGNPLQYSCLENPMDREVWWVTVHRVAKSWTQLSMSTHTNQTVCLAQPGLTPSQASLPAFPPLALLPSLFQGMVNTWLSETWTSALGGRAMVSTWPLSTVMVIEPMVEIQKAIHYSLAGWQVSALAAPPLAFWDTDLSLRTLYSCWNIEQYVHNINYRCNGWVLDYSMVGTELWLLLQNPDKDSCSWRYYGFDILKINKLLVLKNKSSNISNNLFKSRAELGKKQRLSKGQRRRGASSLDSQCHTRPAPQHLLMPAHWNLRVYWQQRGQGLGHMCDWIPYVTPLPHIEVDGFEGLYSQWKVKLGKKKKKNSAHHQRETR